VAKVTWVDKQWTRLGGVFALCVLAVVACDSEDETFAPDGEAGAAGEAGAPGTGGKPEKPWNWGEPLTSERGEFSIANHDHRLINGTWEALRIDEGSTDLRVPFTVEFFDTDEVSVETIEGEPYRFHAKKVGSTIVKFRATDSNGSVEDAFRFEVEDPTSMKMGACERVLGGSGTDVSFYLNARIGPSPQGLLPVEVSPASAAQVEPIGGYLATRFKLPIAAGFVGSFDLRSTLADESYVTLRAVDPIELEPPRIFGQGSVGIGRTFTVAIEAWTAEGVVCSPVPVTLIETEASDCRVLRALPTSFYEPFERPKWELVGDVLGGICELVVQYDQVAFEAIIGAEAYAALPVDVTGPVTVQLDIDFVEPSHSNAVDTGGGSSGSSFGGWD
jgi:hypothetical protein